MNFKRLRTIFVLFAILLVPQVVFSQEHSSMQMGGEHGQMMSHPEAMDDHMKVHHEHVKTMERVFRYERNLAEKAEEIRVGYLYKAGDAESEKDRDAMVMMAKTMVEEGLAGKSISFNPIGVNEDSAVAGQLAGEKINVIYIGSELSDTELAAVKSYSVSEKILVIGSTSAVAEEGAAAVGIIARSEKVDLIINLATANATGVDFDPRLYRLADKVLK